MRHVLVLLLVASLGLNVGLLWQRHHQAAPPAVTGEAPAMFHPRHPGPEMPPGLPGDPRSWAREVAPRVHAGRQRVWRARLALRQALARTELDEDEIAARLQELAAAQQRLDSLVAFSLVEHLRPLPPEQRRHWLERLPWGDRADRGRRRGRHHPAPVPSP